VSAVLSPYYDPGYEDAVRDGRASHRDTIGGMWEEHGTFQRDFLISQGLLPHHRLLDVGCGSFRAGVKLVPYLDPAHYYGIDLNASLLEMGYEREIEPLGLADRLPRENLAATGEFRAEGFGATFDFALAQSVFTHLPINHLRVALERLGPVMASGGIFFATYFEVPNDTITADPLIQQPGGVITYPDRDPYHMRVADLEHAAIGTQWRLVSAGGWGHPKAQQMARFQWK